MKLYFAASLIFIGKISVAIVIIKISPHLIRKVKATEEREIFKEDNEIGFTRLARPH